MDQLSRYLVRPDRCGCLAAACGQEERAVVLPRRYQGVCDIVRPYCRLCPSPSVNGVRAAKPNRAGVSSPGLAQTTATPDLGNAPDNNNSFGAIMTTPPIVAKFPTYYVAGLVPSGPRHNKAPAL